MLKQTQASFAQAQRHFQLLIDIVAKKEAEWPGPFRLHYVKPGVPIAGESPLLQTSCDHRLWLQSRQQHCRQRIRKG